MGLRSSADIVIVQKLLLSDLEQTRIGHVAQSFSGVVKEMGMASTRATLQIDGSGQFGWIAVEGWKEEIHPSQMGPSPLE